MIAMITPPANRVAFSLFGIDVMWYGVLIALGIFLGTALGAKQAERYGISEDNFTSMMLWAIPAAIVGARLYYVLFNLGDYIGNPIEILNTRGGGLAIHGGIIAALVAAYVFARKKKLSFLSLADAAMPGLALGQAIGRWGNFFNHEAYGSPTDLPWGMWINGTTVHPTFLYESIGTFLLFLFLLWFSRKKTRFPGEVLCVYMIVYGVLRFFIEGLRTDSLYFVGLRVAQLVSLAAFIIGIVGLILIRTGKVDTSSGQSRKDKKTRRA